MIEDEGRETLEGGRRSETVAEKEIQFGNICIYMLFLKL